MIRKILIFSLCASALSVFLFVACDEGESVSGPAPSLVVSTASIAVSASGGGNSFTYSLLNSTADGVLNCYSDVEWIYNLDSSVAGTVSFSAYENTSVDPRTGNLTLSYTSSFGTVSENVIVAQNGADSSSGLILSPAVVSAGYKGGSCSFKYAATDYSGGTPDCSSDSDWITGIDCSAAGTVSFSVSQNDGDGIREGLITVTLDDGGSELTGTVTVVQDHAGGFSVTDAGNLVGTYIAKGPAYDWSFEEAEWTMKIFEATDDEEFDLYIDGLTPYMSGLYDEYGDNRYSARAYFWHGSIVIPTHVLSSMLPDYAYYVGYTPCLAFEDNQIYYSSDWPSVTFTYDADSLSWTSDYGTIVMGVTSSIFQYFPFYFDVTLPTVSMTKISSSTETPVAASSSAGLMESRESSSGRLVLKASPNVL